MKCKVENSCVTVQGIYIDSLNFQRAICIHTSEHALENLRRLSLELSL